MQEDKLKQVEVARARLVKRVEATGEIFEIVEGGDGMETVAVYRVPGMPADWYSDAPYKPREGEPCQN